MKYNALYEHGFALKCHRPEAPARCSFFIQSRGDNAGRPTWAPMRNCFALTCAPEDVGGYYYLVYALWQAKRFAPYIHGSVIPLIRIGDVWRLIADNLDTRPRIEKALPTLDALNSAEANYTRQLSLIKECRCVLLRQITRPAATDAG